MEQPQVDGMAALRMAKQRLRAVTRERLASLSIEVVQEQSRSVTAALTSLPEYKASRSIGIYLSMPTGEIATKEIVRDALDRGKRVFVPLIYTQSPREGDLPSKLMDMVALQSMEDHSACESNRDRWGIPTVKDADALVRERILGAAGNGGEEAEGDRNALGLSARSLGTQLDLIVLPGMAFDKQLGRLGHGKGFYDFFLHRYEAATRLGSGTARPMPFLVGVALNEQILSDGDTVPRNNLDWPLDAVVCGEGVVLRLEEN